MSERINLEAQYCAQNYHPLPVVLTRAEGAYVWDENGKKYLDMMSAYSAVSHGHGHERLVKLVQQQVERLNIVSRAFYTDKLGPFLEKACTMTGQDMALPMNTGAEAVETAIKAARKWGYEVKGIEKDKAEIIACTGNFHGRTTLIVAMSDEPQYQYGFGPFPPGFKLAPFGDAAALDGAAEIVDADGCRAARGHRRRRQFAVDHRGGDDVLRIERGKPAGKVFQLADISRP